MLFIEFLRGFRVSWTLSDGFLPLALGDRTFPDIQVNADLDEYLILHHADAVTHEEAWWFWGEYQMSKI